MSAIETLKHDHEITPGSDRSFGFVFAGFFALVALWPLVHGRTVRMWALGLSPLFLAAALIVPTILHPLNVLWARLGARLNRITTPIFTGLMFFVLFTPIAYVARLCGKEFLRLKPSEADSYWIPREPPGPAPDSIRHQF